MKNSVRKTRLPTGVVQRLSTNMGGGSHRSKRDYDRKREKQELKNLARKHFD